MRPKVEEPEGQTVHEILCRALNSVSSPRQRYMFETTRLFQYWMFSDDNGKLENPSTSRLEALSKLSPLGFTKTRFELPRPNDLIESEDSTKIPSQGPATVQLQEPELLSVAEFESLFSNQLGSTFPGLTGGQLNHLIKVASEYSVLLSEKTEFEQSGNLTYADRDQRDDDVFLPTPQALPKFEPRDAFVGLMYRLNGPAYIDSGAGYYGPLQVSIDEGLQRAGADVRTVVGKSAAAANELAVLLQAAEWLADANPSGFFEALFAADKKRAALGRILNTDKIDKLKRRASTFNMNTGQMHYYRELGISAFYLMNGRGLKAPTIGKMLLPKSANARATIADEVTALQKEQWLQDFTVATWDGKNLPFVLGATWCVLLDAVTAMNKMVLTAKNRMVSRPKRQM